MDTEDETTMEEFDIIDIGSIQVNLFDIIGIDRDKIYLRTGGSIPLTSEEEHDTFRTAYRKAVKESVTVQPIECDTCERRYVMQELNGSYNVCSAQQNKPISGVTLRDPTCPLKANWK